MVSASFLTIVVLPEQGSPVIHKQKAIRSEERREGKSVDLGGRRIIKKKKKTTQKKNKQKKTIEYLEHK